jgi:hypothetical protein
MEQQPQEPKRLGRGLGRARPEAAIAGDDAPQAPAGRKPWKITFEALANAHVRPATPRDKVGDPFEPYQPAPGVLPAGESAQMALDDVSSSVIGWAGQGAGFYGSDIYEEGQTFLGYPQLSLMAQRPEYRVISETLADEATRKWIEIKAASEDEDKSEKIRLIEEEFKRLRVRECFRKAAEQDGFFGRGHIYIDTGDTENAPELATNLGDSRSAISKGKVSPDHPVKRLINVEAVWTYPSFYNSTNPLAKDWYRPASWYVMGRQVHQSRLLTFVAREVPDLLKPAYSFGGLSMSQMVKPYVDNWVVTRQSVQALIKAFSTFVLKTNMAGTLSMGGDDFYKRLDIFNATRDNRGVMAIDKTEEDFANVSAPLGGLDHLQAQSQEHMASVSKIPLVKLTGISPSGLNASSEGELQCWNDAVHSYQEAFFRAHLETVLNFVQLSLFGELDPGIVIEFLPIVEQSEMEKAQLRQTEAQTDQVLVEIGVISQQEVRKRVATDPDTPYAGLDIDEMPDLQGEEAAGLMPGEQPGEDPVPEKTDHSQRISALFGGEGKKSKAPPPFGQDAALGDQPKRKRGRPRKSNADTGPCPSQV